MKWYFVVIFGIAGLLYIFSEGKKVFMLKENVAVSIAESKVNKWNRQNQILNKCMGLAYLIVPVCWILEQRNLISNFNVYLEVSCALIVLLYLLKRIVNKRVFRRFFIEDILEVKKIKER